MLTRKCLESVKFSVWKIGVTEVSINNKMGLQGPESRSFYDVVYVLLWTWCQMLIFKQTLPSSIQNCMFWKIPSTWFNSSKSIHLKFYTGIVPSPLWNSSAQFEVNQAICLNICTKGVKQQRYSHLIDIFLVLFGSWNFKMLELES